MIGGTLARRRGKGTGGDRKFARTETLRDLAAERVHAPAAARSSGSRGGYHPRRRPQLLAPRGGEDVVGGHGELLPGTRWASDAIDTGNRERGWQSSWGAGREAFGSIG
jgi:hypothetical protein